MDILTDIRRFALKMQIGKWGNSLAVRLPREVIEDCGFKAGDVIDSEVFKQAVKIVDQAAIEARRDEAMKKFDERAFALPPDWKFDREEANWRPAMDKW